jgi:multisubunit Na+/H+ antiporter MnhF subunit
LAIVTPWLAACFGLLAVLAGAALASCRGTFTQRVVGLQLATIVTTLLLAAMTYAFGQPALIDLALGLALLGPPGALLLALFVERWL